MKLIPLSNTRKRKHYGKYSAIVDDDMFEELSQYHWSVRLYTGKPYAARRNPDKYPVNILMHRHIKGLTDPKIQVDHKNGNGLDNREGNLRVCSSGENNRNKPKRGVKCSSEYKGVSWSSLHDKFRACVQLNGKRYEMGLYVDEKEAARAYNEGAKKYHGEFAYLNVIE